MKWTNASGDFNAQNPDNWEGGVIPQTVKEWEMATTSPRICSFCGKTYWDSEGFSTLHCSLKCNSLDIHDFWMTAADRDRLQKINNELVGVLMEMVSAMCRYEMDVDGPPPPEHVQMMERVRTALQKATDGRLP